MKITSEYIHVHAKNKRHLHLRVIITSEFIKTTRIFLSFSFFFQQSQVPLFFSPQLNHNTELPLSIWRDHGKYMYFWYSLFWASQMILSISLLGILGWNQQQYWPFRWPFALFTSGCPRTEIFFLACNTYFHGSIWATRAKCCFPCKHGPDKLQEIALQQAYSNFYSNFISQGYLHFFAGLFIFYKNIFSLWWIPVTTK